MISALRCMAIATRTSGPTPQVSGLKNGDTAGAVLNGGSLSRVAGENVGVYGINQGQPLDNPSLTVITDAEGGVE